MTDWSSVPTFDCPDAALPLRVRPSAYALVRNPAGRLAMVQAPLGLYLPGGGSEPGESARATVQRETNEEISLRVAVGNWRRMAIEHVPVPSEGASFEKRSTFCDATLLDEAVAASEPEHAAVWVTPAEAIARLSPASHRWAVTQWVSDHDDAHRSSRPAV